MPISALNTMSAMYYIENNSSSSQKIEPISTVKSRQDRVTISQEAYNALAKTKEQQGFEQSVQKRPKNDLYLQTYEEKMDNPTKVFAQFMKEARGEIEDVRGLTAEEKLKKMIEKLQRQLEKTAKDEETSPEVKQAMTETLLEQISELTMALEDMLRTGKKGLMGL